MAIIGITYVCLDKTKLQRIQIFGLGNEAYYSPSDVNLLRN